MTNTEDVRCGSTWQPNLPNPQPPFGCKIIMLGLFFQVGGWKGSFARPCLSSSPVSSSFVRSWELFSRISCQSWKGQRGKTESHKLQFKICAAGDGRMEHSASSLFALFQHILPLHLQLNTCWEQQKPLGLSANCYRAKMHLRPLKTQKNMIQILILTVQIRWLCAGGSLSFSASPPSGRVKQN